VLELEQAEHGHVLNAVRANMGHRDLLQHAGLDDLSDNTAAKAMVARRLNALLTKVRRDAQSHPT
jgi:hypothetical protein